MMWKFLRIILIGILLSVIMSCSGSDPELYSKGPGDSGDNGGQNITGKVSVAYLKSLYASSPVEVKYDIFIRGRIVSSDRSGNFYKTLCVEDETGGIAVRIDDEEIFRNYGLDKMVKINCNSLTLGAYGGLVQLGIASSDGKYQADPIPAYLIPSFLIPDGEPDEYPEPPLLAIDKLAPEHLSRFIEIEGVQFEESVLDLLWSEPDSDTDRMLVDKQGNKLAVRTSRFAKFATWILPSGSGSVRGVLSYFNGNYQLVLNEAYDAVLENGRF